MSGTTRHDRLTELAARLGPREWFVLEVVTRLRFVSSGQLSRLAFYEIEQQATRARVTQRALARLIQRGLLHRLDRRMGGVRAGSSGYVYSVTAEALRLLAFRRGDDPSTTRRTTEPGTTFVEHALLVSEVFVRLTEANRNSDVDLLRHEAEPECWRSFQRLGGPAALKPDSFVALGVGELEHRAFLEVDRGTEGSTTLRRKLGAYVDYWRTEAEQTAHGIFPRIVWLMDRPRRVDLVRQLIAELPARAQILFSAGSVDDALGLITGGTS